MADDSKNPPVGSTPATSTQKDDSFRLTESEKRDKEVNEAVKAAAKLMKKPIDDLKADEVDPGVATEEVTTTKDEIDQISQQSTLKVIDDRLKQLSRIDFVTISFSKTGLFVALGIIMVVIWLIPIINFGLIKVSKGQLSLDNFSSDQVFGIKKPVVVANACPTPQPEMKIRIKTNQDSLEAVNKMNNLLKQAGFGSVESIYDKEVTNKGVLIATKGNDLQLREKILAALGEEYSVSSESATLTEDSDFSVAILVGENQELKTKK